MARPHGLTCVCHHCGLYDGDPVFRAFWDKDKSAHYRLSHPCFHLGKVIERDRNCWKCFTHQCDKHGKCRQDFDGKDGIRICTRCSDYAEEEPSLRDYFDRVVVVSLKRRPDRLAAVIAQLKDWPFRQPEVFEAIDGLLLPTPAGWETGGPSYGCLRSNSQVLEKAISDGVGRLLVLEDDMVLCEDFAAKVEQFIDAVPSDAQGLMLGGQHEPRAMAVKPGVVRCLRTGRTHAYSVQGEWMRALYAAWTSPNARVHCDWIMRDMVKQFKVYAPDPFLIYQAAGRSDITCRVEEERRWA